MRDGADGKALVFLRLVEALDDRRMRFLPTTLEVDPSRDPPVVVKQSRQVVLRTWTAADLVTRLEARGFAVCLHGDVQGAPWDPATSSDLVVVARRAGGEGEA